MTCQFFWNHLHRSRIEQVLTKDLPSPFHHTKRPVQACTGLFLTPFGASIRLNYLCENRKVTFRWGLVFLTIVNTLVAS